MKDQIKPLDVKPLPVALQRIIDEVRAEAAHVTGTAYNRVYSRHNRS